MSKPCVVKSCGRMLTDSQVQPACAPHWAQVPQETRAVYLHAITYDDWLGAWMAIAELTKENAVST